MKSQTPYPEILYKRLAEQFRLPDSIAVMLDAKEEVGWPDWCYLPMSASYAIASKGADIPFAMRYMATSGAQDFYALSAIIPWSYGKPVYRFDAELAESLMETEADENVVPVGVIKRLPFPGIFIESPPGLDGCIGLFAFLDYDYRYPETVELRMHYAFKDQIVPVYIQWTEERDVLDEIMLLNSVRLADELNGVRLQFDEKLHEACFDIAPRHLNLILYLCAEDPDLKRESPIPRIRSHKGAPPAASYTDIVQVGAYVGSVIRKGKAEARANGGSGGSSSPHRPHVRRAHWHLYWTGEGRKTPVVKWIMPIFVHADKERDTVIHHVKE